MSIVEINIEKKMTHVARNNNIFDTNGGIELINSLIWVIQEMSIFLVAMKSA